MFENEAVLAGAYNICFSDSSDMLHKIDFRREQLIIYCTDYVEENRYQVKNAIQLRKDLPPFNSSAQVF